MSLSLLQPSFFMSKTRSYAYILIGFQLFLTAMAIHLSGNSRILYVHVPVAWMSILVYLVMDISSSFFLLTKHPLFLRSSGTGTEIGAFSTFFTLVTGAFWGRPMWGTFWVWDARLTYVLILFLIYLGALCFQNISRSGTSIHVSMLIPILSNFANSPFFTLFFFVLETCLLILSFLESSLTEEIEA
ncbi:hypothetical protein MKW98_012654 [Papaver atlanticum]|uniref:Cytochrome c assembly protein domain-containing protein n=1 Tax=Papaver atlanticum TaxID=357466 RepID=A0AAD4T265_9MAGN|nr:hypothetical protein MKW98_012654 [Papaver atlanticum]